MTAVDPDEDAGRQHEVEGEIGEAEHAGKGGHAERPVLDAALDEDLEPLLQVDDRGRVALGGREVELAEAADQLVEAVEPEQCRDLHRAAVR